MFNSTGLDSLLLYRSILIYNIHLYRSISYGAPTILHQSFCNYTARFSRTYITHSIKDRRNSEISCSWDTQHLTLLAKNWFNLFGFFLIKERALRRKWYRDMCQGKIRQRQNNIIIVGKAIHMTTVDIRVQFWWCSGHMEKIIRLVIVFIQTYLRSFSSHPSNRYCGLYSS